MALAFGEIGSLLDYELFNPSIETRACRLFRIVAGRFAKKFVLIHTDATDGAPQPITMTTFGVSRSGIMTQIDTKTFSGFNTKSWWCAGQLNNNIYVVINTYKVVGTFFVDDDGIIGSLLDTYTDNTIATEVYDYPDCIVKVLGSDGIMAASFGTTVGVIETFKIKTFLIDETTGVISGVLSDLSLSTDTRNVRSSVCHARGDYYLVIGTNYSNIGGYNDYLLVMKTVSINSSTGVVVLAKTDPTSFRFFALRPMRLIPMPLTKEGLCTFLYPYRTGINWVNYRARTIQVESDGTITWVMATYVVISSSADATWFKAEGYELEPRLLGFYGSTEYSTKVETVTLDINGNMLVSDTVEANAEYGGRGDVILGRIPGMIMIANTCQDKTNLDGTNVRIYLYESGVVIPVPANSARSELLELI